MIDLDVDLPPLEFILRARAGPAGVTDRLPNPAVSRHVQAIRAIERRNVAARRRVKGVRPWHVLNQFSDETGRSILLAVRIAGIQRVAEYAETLHRTCGARNPGPVERVAQQVHYRAIRECCPSRWRVASALPLFTPGKKRKIPCRARSVRTRRIDVVSASRSGHQTNEEKRFVSDDRPAQASRCTDAGCPRRRQGPADCSTTNWRSVPSSAHSRLRAPWN